MVRREIQRLEVVPVVLDLRAVGTLVTEPREDRGDTLERTRDRMNAAAFAVAPRQADVEPLGARRLSISACSSTACAPPAHRRDDP
jgi:hypothetical protein